MLMIHLIASNYEDSGITPWGHITKLILKTNQENHVSKRIVLSITFMNLTKTGILLKKQ